MSSDLRVVLEVVASFTLPSEAGSFGVSVGPAGKATACTVDFTPNTNKSAPFYEVPVSCGGIKDSLRCPDGSQQGLTGDHV